jgi:SAM-dependent methyltransferase
MKYRPIPPVLVIRTLARNIEANGFRSAMVDFFQRLFRSIRNRGIGGTLGRVVRNPPAKSQKELMLPQPHPFDLLHGTDTSAYISGANLSAVSLLGLYITAYAGIPPSALTRALSELSIQHEDFTFVNIGCGKGRALMVAAQFSFRYLLGVEIASELCDIAEANIATNPDWKSRITVLNHDATNVTYPDGPIFLYLYNPFLAPVLRRALHNLERQLRHSPRPAYLFYVMNPRFTEVLDSFPFLKEISDTTYPFSAEETAHDHFHRTEEHFTLYSADITR